MKLSDMLMNIEYGTALCVKEADGTIIFDDTWEAYFNAKDYHGDIDTVTAMDSTIHITLWGYDDD